MNPKDGFADRHTSVGLKAWNRVRAALASTMNLALATT